MLKINFNTHKQEPKPSTKLNSSVERQKDGMQALGSRKDEDIYEGS